MSEAPTIDRIVRSRRKTVALLVTPDGRLEIRAPHQLTHKQIDAIVAEKSAWIRKNLERARRTAADSPCREIMAGSRFWYLGRIYPLHLVDKSAGRLQFSSEFSLRSDALPKVTGQLTAWYKNQARNILTERTEFYARQFGLKYRSLRITSARTRWGSCSRLDALSFTWRLIMAPLEIIDYIVVHELAHVVEKNHSRAFWTQVERMLPDYRPRRKWLKTNGRLLDLSIDADESLIR
jgi:predicted metal-dependent hydrolase